MRKMGKEKPVLLIPVENQVRELDAKLLLACIAARRGLPSIIGSKREVEARIANFPRSIYLAKSMLHGHSKFLKIARKLGHEITAWDEDALVHLPPETYFSRRLSPASIGCMSHLFAWGEDNAELWRQYPELPSGIPIHVTGNPRNDLLRPEIQPYYEKEVSNIRDTYGDFILINTNFNHVNAFSPIRNLFLPVDNPGEKPNFGRAARGMAREYAEGLRDLKQATFEHFQTMIPALEKTFADSTIVVRPHQVENPAIYRQIASGCKRVHVINEGNVVLWLMACKVLIHNGCTTSVEAFAMGVPAVSYRATTNDDYDYGFYRLPNMLSHQCFNFEELKQTLKKILCGELGVGNGDERQALIDHYLAAQKGPLACERIIDVLEKAAADLPNLPGPPIGDRLQGWFKANKRRVRRWSKLRKTDSTRSLEHQQNKYPEVPLGEVRARVARFQQVLGDNGRLNVEQICPRLFRISA
jgi:surface carbohydrate biosynthesis protein